MDSKVRTWGFPLTAAWAPWYVCIWTHTPHTTQASHKEGGGERWGVGNEGDKYYLIGKMETALESKSAHLQWHELVNEHSWPHSVLVKTRNQIKLTRFTQRLPWKSHQADSKQELPFLLVRALRVSRILCVCVNQWLTTFSLNRNSSEKQSNES